MVAKLRIANAPCSWGVLEFDVTGTAAAYPQVLDEIAQSGYEGTELGDWGFMPTDPGTLRKELSNRDLAVMAAFVPVALAHPEKHTAGEAVALKTARLLASTAGENCFIVLADENGSNPIRTKYAGRIQPEQGLNEAQWRVFANGVNRIARAVREQTGLRTVFHHHCAGFVETPAEVDTLLKLTDAGLVGLALDTGHYIYGGGDPLQALQTYRDRIWHIHFKDCDPAIAEQARREEWDYLNAVRHGIFCELGKGSVNFPAITKEIKGNGYSGWIVVEQDVLPGMGSPLESAQRNRDYLRSIGL
ncbi:MAG: TIM barrel protein [Chloroflexota bacterium]